MTAAFISDSVSRERAAHNGTVRKGLLDFELVVLNYSVGEELFAHLFNILLGFGFIAVGQVDFDVLTLANCIDAGKTQRVESVFYRFALGVKDPGFERYMNLSFHLICPLVKMGCY